jgi:hypothetical protein
MIIYLLIVLIIVILFFNSIIYNTHYKCSAANKKISYVKGSRLPSKSYKERIGLDTIDLKLDRDVPCGIYYANTIYGTGVLLVGQNNTRRCYFHMDNMNSLEKVYIIDLWDLQRLVSEENNFIKTYNRGCC